MHRHCFFLFFSFFFKRNQPYLPPLFAYFILLFFLFFFLPLPALAGCTGKKAKSVVRAKVVVDFPEIDEALYRWFLSQRSRGFPLGGELLKENAARMHGKFYPEEEEAWEPSNGWLNRWKGRYGIRELIISVESKSSDESAALEYVSTFCKRILEDLCKCRGVASSLLCRCGSLLVFFPLCPPAPFAFRVAASSRLAALLITNKPVCILLLLLQPVLFVISSTRMRVACFIISCLPRAWPLLSRRSKPRGLRYARSD